MPISRGILFLHIFKAAGTSLKHHLFNNLRADACLVDIDSFELTRSQARDLDLDRYALVAGHLDHDYVRCYRRRPLVMTCLRHPLERALSAYYFQRSPWYATAIRNRASRIGEVAAERMLEEWSRLNRCGSLADFLRREPELARKGLGNVQTRCLAGDSAAEAFADRPDRLLAVAIENLQACEAVLLTERLSETLALVASILGVTVPETMPHDNPTLQRPSAAGHDPMVRAALAELTELDAELYRVAEELFERRRQAGAGSSAVPEPPAEMPSAADFTFDLPVRGSGWHVRERGERGWYCWTGPTAELHLSLDTLGNHTLLCRVEHSASYEAWQGLEVSVNGTPVDLTAKPGSPPGLVAARVPARLLGGSPGRVRVGFHVPHVVCPAERDVNNPDMRRLGIALSQVRLTPC